MSAADDESEVDPRQVELRLAAIAFARAREAWLAAPSPPPPGALASVIEAERRLHEAAVRFTLPGADPALLLSAGIAGGEQWFGWYIDDEVLDDEVDP